MSAFIDDNTLKKVANIIGGEDAVHIVMALKKFKETTVDQILAHVVEETDTELKLNDIRKTLFKLYNHSIVQCDRERDENTGWFIFRWRLQQDQIGGFIKNLKKRNLKILKQRYNYETEHDFFYCYTPDCKRFIFEDAIEYVFKCSTCGKTLKHFDNSKIIEALKERINQIEKELKE